MKQLIILLGLLMTTTIKFSDNDESLIFSNNDKGEVWISSMNSAQQTKIIRNELKGDTLFVDYKRGLFVKSNNILPLSKKIRYIIIANKTYIVSFEDNKYSLVEMNR